MQGNRVTQKSGLVEASCFFYLRGIDGGHGLFFFASTFRASVPFHFSIQLSPVLRLPFQKFFPLSQRLDHPTELGFPRVFAHLPNLCVVCHSVNVYRFSFHFLHTATAILPFVCDSFHDHSSICSAPPDTCFTGGIDNPPSPEDSTLDMAMAHLFRHWFIPLVQLRCNAIRFTERNR